MKLEYGKRKFQDKKYIKITNEVNLDSNKVMIKVFNTGNCIDGENITRIWNWFYKSDEARNREEDGT